MIFLASVATDVLYLKGYANESYFKKGVFGCLRTHHFPGFLVLGLLIPSFFRRCHGPGTPGLFDRTTHAPGDFGSRAGHACRCREAVFNVRVGTRSSGTFHAHNHIDR